MAQIIGTTKPLPLASLQSMRTSRRSMSTLLSSPWILFSGTTNSGPIHPLHASFPKFLLNQNPSGNFSLTSQGVVSIMYSTIFWPDASIDTTGNLNDQGILTTICNLADPHSE